MNVEDDWDEVDPDLVKGLVLESLPLVLAEVVGGSTDEESESSDAATAVVYELDSPFIFSSVLLLRALSLSS